MSNIQKTSTGMQEAQNSVRIDSKKTSIMGSINEQKRKEKDDKEQSCKKEKLYDRIVNFWCKMYCKDRVEESAEECYNILNSAFLILFEIPEKRNELRPDLENTITSGSPGVSFTHDVRVNIYNEGGKEMWKLSDEEAMDSSVLKEIRSHSCLGNMSSLNVDGTMLDLWRSLLLRCPECVTAFSLSLALDNFRVFVWEEELQRMTKERKEEERIRREEKERLRKLKEERKKKKVEEKDRAEMERLENETQETNDEEEEIVITGVFNEGRTRAALAKERYSNLMAFFLYHFKMPEVRTELRPDIGNPVVSNSPSLSLKHMVRSKSYRDGLNVMWKLGDEAPMNSRYLKTIATHSCPTRHSSLNTEGTLLELWRSLLLHCPECINERSLKDALDKVREFIEAECKRS